MKVIALFGLVMLMLAGCDSGAKSPPSGLTAAQARYEAQKILTAAKGRAGSAAFIDVVLNQDAKYDEIFTRGLVPLVRAAPIGDPAFSKYASCVRAAEALVKFAELRRIGGGQNQDSDQYRRPYWDQIGECEHAVGG